MNVLTLDIGGTAIKSALFPGAGEAPVDQKELPFDGRRGGPALMEQVLAVIDTYRGFDRIGVSTAGQVDCAGGAITYANQNIPRYTGMPVGDMISRHTGVPVRVENDVNCAAIGEAVSGAGKGKRNFLMLAYGTGIGGAIFIDGGLYRGRNGRAGELGHLVTHGGGRPCACGGRGCYEQYASTTALIRGAREAGLSVEDGRQLFQAVREGNAVALQVLRQWLGEVEAGLVTLTHIFDPERIILGGGIMNEDEIIGRVRRNLPGQLMEGYRSVDVVQAALKSAAALYGALEIARSGEVKNGKN